MSSPESRPTRLARSHQPRAGDLWLVDGPSGAGKSSLAERLVRASPTLQLVRLDDVYPGWHGLAAAVQHLHENVIEPYLLGRGGRYRLWDWAADRPGAEVSVDAARPLLIEGCGAFGTQPSPLTPDRPGDRRIWVDADPAERRRRALTRDAGLFDPWWEIWDAQWREYTGAFAPEARASERIRT